MSANENTQPTAPRDASPVQILTAIIDNADNYSDAIGLVWLNMPAHAIQWGLDEIDEQWGQGPGQE
jgi:hypothetical protein